MENEQEDKNYNYTLPTYSRLLSFPNFKSKLHKKLKVKRDSLIYQVSLEENSSEPCKHYMSYLKAEINLIQYLLEAKEIKDDIWFNRWI